VETTLVGIKELRRAILMMAQCLEDPDRFACCAWCQTFYDKKTGERIVELTNEEFDCTRTDGTSHSMCPTCKDAQLVELEPKTGAGR
jgi:hypothetical protein